MDNKKFWKTLKPLVSDKRTCGSSKINLVVDDKNLPNGKEIVETFNNYFNNAVKSLNTCMMFLMKMILLK